MFRIIIIFFCLPLSIFANKTIIIGIAGGTGSGKTTLAKKIHQSFPASLLISQDSYYRDLSHLSPEERDRVNFDHPDSLEFSLLQKHLIDLKNGLAIDQPLYSFHTHTRESITTLIEPSNIILVEGILLLAAPEVRDLFDIKVFVDTDEDIRVLRRIDRDIKERSRDFDGVMAQYLETVKPMHDTIVEPSKQYADIIIPGDKNNQVAMDLLLAKLREAF